MNKKSRPDKYVSEEVIQSVKRLSDFSPKMLCHINKDLYPKAGFEQLMEEAKVDIKLKKIKKPFFHLTTADDPIMGPYLPIEHLNEYVMVGTTKYGGHCGYFEGKYLPSEQWFPKPAFEFLDYFAKNSKDGPLSK